MSNFSSLTEHPYVEQSESLKKIYETISRIAQFPASVCLTGESGVGKTHFAKLLHRLSPQKDKPFITVNCTAIPSSLLETELFGYEKGAYTGARSEGKAGLIELSHNGTLFLEEIGDLSLEMQVKLLNVLQEKVIMRVGGTKAKKVEFRLITATNQDLINEIQAGKFRLDLFYRIHVFPIRIPSLRERREDIIPLVLYYLKQFNHQYGLNHQFSEGALKCFEAYDWPGNIRQLQNIVERSLLVARDSTIKYEDLPSFVRFNRRENLVSTIPGGTTHDYIPKKGERKGKTLKEIMTEVEKAVILDAYKELKSPTKIAKYLGISQPSASMKLKKYLK